ncbi:Phosphatidylinositol kinase (PIK-L3) [Phytophthora cinnamomi]|uniref:Phosphatidylinositol kinase (PIK-L3) n=1 Tax=Phytophthora cinnamomi TaxID=4785 RepID=UPI003559FBB4|nr:Phosphatidylinositol kinase (PIK-L3) [Phytophthora cinnamomi]
MNVEVVRQKLVDGDPDAVLKELVDLYRRAEILHTPQLGRILEALFPVWKGLLHSKLPPQLRSTTQNRCRKVLLQILNRLPSNEALRPYVAQLLQLLMEVLQKDNEDNALIALKTLFDLHRNYRPGLRNEVQPFLELVQLMYKNLQTTMKKHATGNATPGSDPATDEPICSNLESFKTISELPLIIMLLFQCYPSYIESYIPVLVPLMMSALALRAPDTAATTHPSRYLDFLDCQVKTLSFVTYLLRGCANLMRPFQDAICENTVKLLVACPKDAFVLRKDIFVAARHIISTDFRRGFYPQLELLMNDDVLLPRLTKTEPVPKMLRAALARVCRKLFVLLPHQKNEKHEAFVAEFKDAFERDFTPLAGDDEQQQDGVATTLYEIMNRLKRWKSLLQLRVKKVGKRNAGRLYLEQCSRHLMELSSSNMEVPGQYVSDSEPIKDLHARIQHFENSVDVLLRNGFTQRRVSMGGSDGRTYYFLVQYAMTHITRTDERMMQMYLLLNRLLLRHKETKKRNTVFHVPKVIPLTPRVRLLEDNRDFVTLGEIYELDCQVESKDPDFPVELYRERVCEAYAAAGTENDSNKREEERVTQAKARAFNEICDEHVPETLLAKYVHGISAHSDAYFQFRSEFTKHLALSSFLSYALFVGDRAPHRVLFSRRTGRVVSTELRPGYASSGILEAATTMPFRLTRNLHSFMTRPGVQGPFSVGMTAAAEALTSEEDILSNQLCLFFRDDLLSWHASKTRLLSLDPQSAGRVSSPGASSGPTSPAAVAQRRVESQVQQRVEANVNLVLERIRGVSLKKENGESARGKSVRELLDVAMSPERQREMYPTWYPWL